MYLSVCVRATALAFKKAILAVMGDWRTSVEDSLRAADAHLSTRIPSRTPLRMLAHASVGYPQPSRSARWATISVEPTASGVWFGDRLAIAVFSGDLQVDEALQLAPFVAAQSTVHRFGPFQPRGLARATPPALWPGLGLSCGFRGIT